MGLGTNIYHNILLSQILLCFSCHCTYYVVQAIAGGQADVLELGLQLRWHHAAVRGRCGPDEGRGDEEGEGEVIHLKAKVG